MTAVAALPEIFRPLLWSYQFDQINPEEDLETIVLQAINYGTLAHWRWLAQRYGEDGIREGNVGAPLWGGSKLGPPILPPRLSQQAVNIRQQMTQ